MRFCEGQKKKLNFYEDLMNQDQNFDMINKNLEEKKQKEFESEEEYESKDEILLLPLANNSKTNQNPE